MIKKYHIILRVIITILTTYFGLNAKSQYITETIEYTPAPGQFINTSGWGLPSSASSLSGGLSGAVSLGSFGGFIVFKFDDPVENDQDNPFGIDFVIVGNPLENISNTALNNNVTWAEPGIVSVMKDENSNGEADDTWYELAGSDYFFSTTIKNYSVTYTNPGGDVAANVPWIDNQGDSGYVYANSYHTQPYYPQPENFTGIDSVSYTLSGTRVKDFVDFSDASSITNAGRPWGYVDNNLRNTYDGSPDNPYTDNEEEGSGSDAFDISWAVDNDGNYVDLDEVDFIKVHCAVLADAGWLGEVSTEIRGAFDVAADASVSDWDSTSLVLNNIPIEVSVGEIYQLEAVFFIKGRIIDDAVITWSASPESSVTIDSDNNLTTTDTGSVTITAACTYNGISYTESMTTTVIAPASIEISFDHPEIRVAQKYLIEASVFDQDGEELSGLNLIWKTSNNNITLKEYNDSIYVAGQQTGTSQIYVYPEGYPDLNDTADITILEAADSISVYLTIKTNTDSYFPRTEIKVSNFELSPFISDANHSYDMSDITEITAAHVIASVFDNISFESDLRFKDTEDNGLYIYKLPETSGSQTTYYYGYGNNDSTNTSCWYVNINNDTCYRNLDTISIYENDEVIAWYAADSTSSDNSSSDTSGNTSIINTTNSTLSSLEGFTIHPNPATNNLIIEASSAETETTIAIYTTSGRLVFRKGFNSWTGKYQLNLSDWEAGVYFVKIATPNATADKMLIINK